ncbi:hypothetical protein [Acinetobacter oleivorans]|uniref:hypothetical protein n=1 Tax=Acinetobacter oleivorans TaxID=1148157 RepID=UPI00125072CF|nr:hypothetical protein [Acinetobacter oleivorans]
MASTRQVKTPGAAPEPTTVEEKVQATESEATEQQPADTTPDDQAQTGDDEAETEPTVDQAALIEQLQNQLAASEANNQALKGQLRREATKTTDAANVPTETVQAGTPYLSPKGWTRGA